MIVPIDRVASWSGTEPPDGRTVQAQFRWDGGHEACDYDLACDVEEEVEIVRWIDGVDVLVLGDQPMMTAWLPRDRGGLLVRWFAAEQEADVHALVDTLDDPVRWDDPAPLIWRALGPSVLFDSALDGEDAHAEDHAELRLAKGDYEVFTCFPSDPDTRTSLVVHALRRP